jgi:hypothetical protein
VAGRLPAEQLQDHWLALLLVVLLPGAAIGAATGLIGQGKTVDAPPGTLLEFRLTRPVIL